MIIDGQLIWDELWIMRDRVDEVHDRTLVVGDRAVERGIREWCAAHDGTTVHVDYSPNHIELIERTGEQPHARDMIYRADDDPHVVAFGLVEKPAGQFGFTNVDAYVTMFLMAHTRSRIRVTLEPRHLRFEALADTVPVLRYTHDNRCALESAVVNQTCRVGQGAECCAFLTTGAEGFTCSKFSSSSRHLMNRALNERMTARRIGGCRVRGRDAGGINRHGECYERAN